MAGLSSQARQLRCLAVHIRYIHFRSSGIAICIDYHKLIDTVFRHGTASCRSVVCNGAIRCVYSLNGTGTRSGSRCRRPCKSCAVCPCHRIPGDGNGRQILHFGCLDHLIRPGSDNRRNVACSVGYLHMKIFRCLCGFRSGIYSLVASIRCSQRVPCGRLSGCIRPGIFYLRQTAASGIRREYSNVQRIVHRISVCAVAAPQDYRRFFRINFLYFYGFRNHITIGILQCDGIGSVVCHLQGFCSGFCRNRL